jgi:hypothetical protein
MVFAGGLFRAVSGQPRGGLAAVEEATGAVSTWNPIPDAGIWAMTPFGTTLYVGGDFASVGFTPQVNVAAVAMPTVTITPGLASVPSGSPAVSFATVAPNPVRGLGRIMFRLTSSGRVKASIYDLQGRQMTVIGDDLIRAPGTYELAMRTDTWPAGTYFCRFDDSVRILARKVVVVR